MRQPGGGMAGRDWPGPICIANASTWSVWGSRQLLRTNCFPRLSFFPQFSPSFVRWVLLTRLTTDDVFPFYTWTRASTPFVEICDMLNLHQSTQRYSHTLHASNLIRDRTNHSTNKKTKNENDRKKNHPLTLHEIVPGSHRCHHYIAGCEPLDREGER